MPTKSADLQNQINELDLLIQQGASDAQLNLWEIQRKDLQGQLQAVLTEESQQKITTERIGYILDNMAVEGLTIAEIITNDDEYKLVRKGVQDAFIAQAESFQTELKDQEESNGATVKALTDRANASDQANEQLKKDIQTLETANFQLTLDNEGLDEKVRKGAEQNHELNQQLEQKNQHIADLQNQIAIGVRGALNVVDVPQDTSKMAAEIIARKIRITNVRFSDVNGISTRFKKAENVLTGETIEYEGLYEKRYIILDPKEAEQYRADEANRKAEIEAQNTVIPVMEPQPEHVEELVADAEPQPIEEGNKVDAATPGLADSESTEVRQAQTAESEVKPIMSNDDLHTRFERIERELNLKSFNDYKRKELEELVA